MSYSKSVEQLEQRTLLAAGELDPSFGDAGVVITDLDVGPVVVLPQPDGKVVVVANELTQEYEPPYTQTYRVALVRYNADGSLDSSFGGGDGIVISGVPGWDSFRPMQAVLLGGDNVLVHGQIERRYDPDHPDRPTFGYLTVRFSAAGVSELTSEPASIIPVGEWRSYRELGDGRVVVAGEDTNGTPNVFTDDVAFVSRLNANNTIDSSFGNNGRFILPRSFVDAHALWNLDVRPDGRIVVIQSTDQGPLVAQLTPSGTADTTFGGGDGVLLLPPTQWTYMNFAAAPDGGFLASAWIVHSPLPESIVKLTAEGLVDPSFTNTFGSGKLDVQPDGKILVGSGSFITRLNANGTRDLTFGDNGYFYTASAISGLSAVFKQAITPNAIYGAGGHIDKLAVFRVQNNPNAGGGADVNTVTVEVSLGYMYVIGTGGADAITIATEDDSVVVTANGVTKTFTSDQVRQVSVIGGGGNDYIDLRDLAAITTQDIELPVTIEGADGNDVLVGSQGNDRITGGTGIDRINGWSGDDLISGNAQGDRIDGGAGDDHILGNGGRDRLGGGDGDDSIQGGDQPDFLAGHDGNDSLEGQGSHDRLDGGAGSDLLSGAGGDDTFFARDQEADTLVGGLLGHDRAFADTLDSTVGIEELLP